MSVAPMMDRTDRHFRFMMRLITRRTLLYTEMVTARAVLHGDRARVLGYSEEEHPLALQLGGDDPSELAEAARIGEDFGYDEVNLNVGCPSDRVQAGRFGACLMAEPERVADAVAAMRSRVRVPVTVKHRIGIDDRDRYEDMLRFVDVVASAGCDRFTVHARKACLAGLSPKENRVVPPLRHADVYRLKRERPKLTIELNGGVASLEDVRRHLASADAVMVGRAAYDDPYLFAAADRLFFGVVVPARTRRQVIEAMIPYVERRTAEGDRLQAIVRHMHNVYRAASGARAFRRRLGLGARSPGAGVEVLTGALGAVEEEARP